MLRARFLRTWTVALGAALALVSTARTSHAIVDGEKDDTDGVVSIGDPDAPSCSGTVIGPRLVLTAAHCVTGALVVNVDDRQISVASARVHPEFDESTMDHDIAILVLSENANVPAVPVGVTVPSEGDRVRFVGFGRTAAGADTKGRRSGTVKVKEIETKQFKTVPDPSTACGRDSGGAVMDENGTRLIGVISAGDTKCEKYAYVTRLDVHQVFIDNTTSEFESGGCNATGTRRTASSALESLLVLSLVVAMRRRFDRAQSRA